MRAIAQTLNSNLVMVTIFVYNGKKMSLKEMEGGFRMTCISRNGQQGAFPTSIVSQLLVMTDLATNS